jgi:hypothetical protein
LLSAVSAWFAAPVPRPPQPINPTFNFRLSGLAKLIAGKAKEAAAVVLRKVRREDRVEAVMWQR